MKEGYYGIVWGEVKRFDEPDKQLFMVYYGLYLNGIFIGISFLINKNESGVGKDCLLSFYSK